MSAHPSRGARSPVPAQGARHQQPQPDPQPSAASSGRSPPLGQGQSATAFSTTGDNATAATAGHASSATTTTGHPANAPPLRPPDLIAERTSAARRQTSMLMLLRPLDDQTGDPVMETAAKAQEMLHSKLNIRDMDPFQRRVNPALERIPSSAMYRRDIPEPTVTDPRALNPVILARRRLLVGCMMLGSIAGLASQARLELTVSREPHEYHVMDAWFERAFQNVMETVPAPGSGGGGAGSGGDGLAASASNSAMDSERDPRRAAFLAGMVATLAEACALRFGGFVGEDVNLSRRHTNYGCVSEQLKADLVVCSDAFDADAFEAGVAAALKLSRVDAEPTASTPDGSSPAAAAGEGHANNTTSPPPRPRHADPDDSTMTFASEASPSPARGGGVRDRGGSHHQHADEDTVFAVPRHSTKLLGIVLGQRVALAALVVRWQRASEHDGERSLNCATSCGAGWSVALSSVVRTLSSDKAKHVCVMTEEPNITGKKDTSTIFRIFNVVSFDAKEDKVTLEKDGTGLFFGSLTQPLTSHEDEHSNPSMWFAGMIDLRLVVLPTSQRDRQNFHEAIANVFDRPERDKRRRWLELLGIAPFMDVVPTNSEREFANSDGALPLRAPLRTVATLLASHARLFGGALRFHYAVQLLQYAFPYMTAATAETLVKSMCPIAFLPARPEVSSQWSVFTLPDSISQTLPFTPPNDDPSELENAMRATTLVTTDTGATVDNPLLLFEPQGFGMPALVHRLLQRKFEFMKTGIHFSMPAHPGEFLLTVANDKDRGVIMGFNGDASTALAFVDGNSPRPVHGSNAPVHYSTYHAEVATPLTAGFRDCRSKYPQQRRYDKFLREGISMYSKWPRGWPVARVRRAHATLLGTLQTVLGPRFFTSLPLEVPVTPSVCVGDLKSALGREAAPIFDGAVAMLLRPTLDHVPFRAKLPNRPPEMSLLVPKIALAVSHLLSEVSATEGPARWCLTWGPYVLESSMLLDETQVLSAAVFGQRFSANVCGRVWEPHHVSVAFDNDPARPGWQRDDHHFHTHLFWPPARFVADVNPVCGAWQNTITVFVHAAALTLLLTPRELAAARGQLARMHMAKTPFCSYFAPLLHEVQVLMQPSEVPPPPTGAPGTSGSSSAAASSGIPGAAGSTQQQQQSPLGAPAASQGLGSSMSGGTTSGGVSAGLGASSSNTGASGLAASSSGQQQPAAQLTSRGSTSSPQPQNTAAASGDGAAQASGSGAAATQQTTQQGAGGGGRSATGPSALSAADVHHWVTDRLSHGIDKAAATSITWLDTGDSSHRYEASASRGKQRARVKQDAEQLENYIQPLLPTVEVASLGHRGGDDPWTCRSIASSQRQTGNLVSGTSVTSAGDVHPPPMQCHTSGLVFPSQPFRSVAVRKRGHAANTQYMVAVDHDGQQQRVYASAAVPSGTGPQLVLSEAIRLAREVAIRS